LKLGSVILVDAEPIKLAQRCQRLCLTTVGVLCDLSCVDAQRIRARYRAEAEFGQRAIT
jgi:hypothetical protein